MNKIIPTKDDIIRQSKSLINSIKNDASSTNKEIPVPDIGPARIDLVSATKSVIRKTEEIVKSINAETSKFISNKEIQLEYIKNAIKNGILPYSQAKRNISSNDPIKKESAAAYLEYINLKLKESFRESKYHKEKLKESGFQFGTIYITSPVKKISISDKKDSAAVPTMRTQEPMTFRPVRAKSMKVVTITIEFPTEKEVNIEFRHILAQYIAFPYTQIRNKDIARLVLPIDSNIDIYYSYFPILAREYVNKSDIKYKIEKQKDTNTLVAKINPNDIIEWDPDKIEEKRKKIMDEMYSKIPLFFNISSITVDPISSSPDAITVTIELLLGDLEPITRGKRLLFFNSIEGVLEQMGRWANITFSNYSPRSELVNSLIKFKPPTLASNNYMNINNTIKSVANSSIKKLLNNNIPFNMKRELGDSPNTYVYNNNYGIVDISLIPTSMYKSLKLKHINSDIKLSNLYNEISIAIDNESDRLNRTEQYKDWHDPSVVNILIAQKDEDNGNKVKGNIFNIPLLYNGGHLIPLLETSKNKAYSSELFIINYPGLSTTYIPTYFNTYREVGYQQTGYEGLMDENNGEININRINNYDLLIESEIDSFVGDPVDSSILFYNSVIAHSKTKANKLTNINNLVDYDKVKTTWSKLINEHININDNNRQNWLLSIFKMLPLEYSIPTVFDELYKNDINKTKITYKEKITISSASFNNNILDRLNIIDPLLDVVDELKDKSNIFYNNMASLYDYLIYRGVNKLSNNIIGVIYGADNNIKYYENKAKYDDYNKIGKIGNKFRLISDPINSNTAIKNDSDGSPELKYDLYFIQNIEYNTIYPILVLQKANDQNDIRVDYNKEIQILSLLPIYSASHISDLKEYYDVDNWELMSSIQDMINAINVGTQSDIIDKVNGFIDEYIYSINLAIPRKNNKYVIDSLDGIYRSINNLTTSIKYKIYDFILNNKNIIVQLNEDATYPIGVNTPEEDEDNVDDIKDATITYIESNSNTTYDIPKALLTENLAMSVPFIKYYTTMLYEYQLNCRNNKYNNDKYKRDSCKIIRTLKQYAPHLLPDGDPLQTMGGYSTIYPYHKGTNDIIKLTYRTVANSDYFGTLLEVDVNSILTVFNQTLSHYMDKYITQLLPKDPLMINNILNGLKTDSDYNYININNNNDSRFAILNTVELNNELFKITKTIFKEVKDKVTKVIDYINKIDAFKNRYKELVRELNNVANASSYEFTLYNRKIELKRFETNRESILKSNTIQSNTNILKNILIIDSQFITESDRNNKYLTSITKTYKDMFNNIANIKYIKRKDDPIGVIYKAIDTSIPYTQSSDNAKIGIKNAEVVILGLGLADIASFINDSSYSSVFKSKLNNIINDITEYNTNIKIGLLTLPNYSNKVIYQVSKSSDKLNIINEINNIIKDVADKNDNVYIIDSFNILNKNDISTNKYAYSLTKSGYNKLAINILNSISFDKSDSGLTANAVNSASSNINIEKKIFGTDSIHATYYDYVLLYYAAIASKGLDLLKKLTISLNRSIGKSIRTFRDQVQYYDYYYKHLLNIIINNKLIDQKQFKKELNSTLLKNKNNPDDINYIMSRYADEYEILSFIRTTINDLRRINKGLEKESKVKIPVNNRIYLLPNRLTSLANIKDKIQYIAESLTTHHTLSAIGKIQTSDRSLFDLRNKFKQLTITYPTFKSNNILKWKTLTIENDENKGIYTVLDSYNITTINNSIPIHMDGHDNPNIVNLGGPSKIITLSFVTNNVDLLDKIANMAIDYNIPMRKYNLLRGLSPLASRVIKEHSIKNELIYDDKSTQILQKIKEASGASSAIDSSTSDTPVFIDNEIANMIGVQAMVIDQITYDTVPDTTNTFVITLNFRSVDPKQSDRETPTKVNNVVDNFFILSDFTSLISGFWFHRIHGDDNNIGISNLIEGMDRNLEEMIAGIIFFYIINLGPKYLQSIYKIISNIGNDNKTKSDTKLVLELYDVILWILNTTLVKDLIQIIETNNKKNIEIQYGTYFSDVIRRAHNILYTPSPVMSADQIGTIKTKFTKTKEELMPEDMRAIRDKLISQELQNKVKSNNNISQIISEMIDFTSHKNNVLKNDENHHMTYIFYLNDSFFLTLLKYFMTYISRPELIYSELDSVENSMIDNVDGRIFGMAILSTILSRSINLHQSILFTIANHYDKIYSAYYKRFKYLSELKQKLYGRKRRKELERQIRSVRRYMLIYQDWARRIRHILEFDGSGPFKSLNKYMIPSTFSILSTSPSVTDISTIIKQSAIYTRRIIDLYLESMVIRNSASSMLESIYGNLSYILDNITSYNTKINNNESKSNITLVYNRLRNKYQGVYVKTQINNIFNNGKISSNITSKVAKNYDNNYKLELDQWGETNTNLDNYDWFFFNRRNNITINTYSYLLLGNYEDNKVDSNILISKIKNIINSIFKATVKALRYTNKVSSIISVFSDMLHYLNKIRGENNENVAYLGLIGTHNKSLFISFRLIGLFNKYITVPYLSFILTHKRISPDIHKLQLSNRTNYKYLRRGKELIKNIYPVHDNDINLYSIRSIFFLIKDTIDVPWFKRSLYDRFNAYQDRPLPIIVKTNSKLLKRFKDKKFINFDKHELEVLNLVNYITTPDFFVYKDPILLTAEYNVMKSMMDNILGSMTEDDSKEKIDAISINDEYKNKLNRLVNIEINNLNKISRELIDKIIAVELSNSENANSKTNNKKDNDINGKITKKIYDIIDSLTTSKGLSNINSTLYELEKDIRSIIPEETSYNKKANRNLINKINIRELSSTYLKFRQTVLITKRLVKVNSTNNLTSTTKAFIDSIINNSSGAYTDDSIKIMAKKLELTRIINSKVIQPGTFGHSMPTFKLYIIEENENRLLLFNDFYNYASVKSISIHRDKKTATSVAVIEVTNIYGRLTDILNARLMTENPLAARPDGRESVNSFMLRPGAMIQIRLGFNGYLGPESIVFSGEIVEIKGQEVLRITAQGWGSQLTKPIGTGKGVDIAGSFIESLFSKSYTSAGTIMDILDLPEEGIHHLGGVDPFMGQLLSPKRNINVYMNMWKELFMNYLGKLITSGTGIPVTMIDTTLTNIYLVDDTQQGWWGSRRWLVYNETIWDAINDYILQYPGYHIKIAEMDEEGTIVIGKNTDMYQYTYEYNMYTAQIAPLINTLRSGMDNPIRGLNILLELMQREYISNGGKISGPITTLFIKSINEFIKSFPFQGLLSSLLKLAMEIYIKKQYTFGELLVGTLLNDRNITLSNLGLIDSNKNNLDRENIIEKYKESFKMSYEDWINILNELNSFDPKKYIPPKEKQESDKDKEGKPSSGKTTKSSNSSNSSNSEQPDINNIPTTQAQSNAVMIENIDCTMLLSVGKGHVNISQEEINKINNYTDDTMKLIYLTYKKANDISNIGQDIYNKARVGSFIYSIYNNNILYDIYKQAIYETNKPRIRRLWTRFFDMLHKMDGYNIVKNMISDIDQAAFYTMVLREWYTEGILNLGSDDIYYDVITELGGIEGIISLLLTESEMRMFNNKRLDNELTYGFKSLLLNPELIRNIKDNDISNGNINSKYYLLGKDKEPKNRGIGLSQITVIGFDSIVTKKIGVYVNNSNATISIKDYLRTLNGTFGATNKLPIKYAGKLALHLINKTELFNLPNNTKYIDRTPRTLGLFEFTLLGEYFRSIIYNHSKRRRSRFNDISDVTIVNASVIYNSGPIAAYPKGIGSIGQYSFVEPSRVSAYYYGIVGNRTNDLYYGLMKLITDYIIANTSSVLNISNIKNNDKYTTMIAYILGKSIPTIIETIIYDIASTTPGFRPFSSVHLKTASKDIIQNNIELRDGYNRVDLSYMHDDIVGFVLGNLLNMTLVASLLGSSSISIGELNNPDARTNIQISVSPILDPTKIKTYATFQKNAAIRSTFSTPREYVVANSILSNLINDYYGGEIILNLDPTIREYDIIMLYDDVNDYWGMIQVGAVTHMLSKEYGAVTIIKPDLYAENGISLSRETLGALGTISSLFNYMFPVISWFVLTKVGFGLLKYALRFIGKVWKGAGRSTARSMLKKIISDDNIANSVIKRNSKDVIDIVDDLLLNVTKGEAPTSAAGKDAINKFVQNIAKEMDGKTYNSFKSTFNEMVKELHNIRSNMYDDIVRRETSIGKFKIQEKYAKLYLSKIKQYSNIWNSEPFVDELMNSPQFENSVKILTKIAIEKYIAPFTSRSWFGSINPKTNKLGIYGVWLEILSRTIRIGAAYRIGKMFWGDPSRFASSFVAKAGEYFFMREPITIVGLYHKGEPFIANLDGMKKMDIGTTFWDILGERWNYMWAPLSEMLGGLEVMAMDVGSITKIANGDI